MLGLRLTDDSPLRTGTMTTDHCICCLIFWFCVHLLLVLCHCLLTLHCTIMPPMYRSLLAQAVFPMRSPPAHCAVPTINFSQMFRGLRFQNGTLSLQNSFRVVASRNLIFGSSHFPFPQYTRVLVLSALFMFRR